MQGPLEILRASLDGDLYTDSAMRHLYATDASIYREMPLAVAMPKHAEDVCQLIHFARTQGLSLIPRTAGTSLAGQCVGNGIVVDTGFYMNQILEVQPDTGLVRVQPGVVRDELNRAIKPQGLYFGPNTSTANRAMIGGMVGNNSCGSYSIVYGSTRDHVVAVRGFLADGSEVEFRALDREAFEAKCQLNTLEGALYRQLADLLRDPERRREIREQFPDGRIPRRNTGYALDLLLPFFSTPEELAAAQSYRAAIQTPFSALTTPDELNLCNLIAGSEGTLMFLTEITVHCDPLPPAAGALLCIHFHSLREALEATVTAMRHQPRAVELMDDIILQCTKENIEQRKNRFFVQGDPDAILVIEAGGETRGACDAQLDAIEAAMRAGGYGYHFPRVYGADIGKVWALRSAGLGVLSNIPNSPRPVEIIEDTAVRVEDLPEYIREFSEMMAQVGRKAVYYAHAGAGELHLRPMISLKSAEDRPLMRQIAEGSARLVKKYNGSLSGEHGDGRVRAEFIPLMVGASNYASFREIKHTWDPKGLLNPGKIVDAPPMDANLRYDIAEARPEFQTVFDFGKDGMLAVAEQCNGSGDCRKSHLAGGTMCPSFMATRNEKHSTRARANILREILTRTKYENPFARPEIYEVMDLCLSCKGCASECPSNVDVATLKAEFLHQYYQAHGVPLRARAIANIGKLNGLGSAVPGLTNFFLANPLTSGLLKRALGIAPQRSLPALHRQSLRRWHQRHRSRLEALARARGSRGQVYFFCDEFTNYNDTRIGIQALELLAGLGYRAELLRHAESGRAYLSKGLLAEARRMAIYNVEAFHGKADARQPLVGVEPSAILGFRDEYPKLVIPELREAARELGRHALLIDEFLAAEAEAGRIGPADFEGAERRILLHGHCHQKALASVEVSRRILSLPAGYGVEVIPSGCCGMAGSFGYEAEHYGLSMQVGELVLFPAVRSAADALIAAPGTSCRHQIHDGTGRQALHPVEILHAALKRD